MGQNTEFAKIASKEIGNRASKYRQWFYGYEGQGIPWCAVFVSWCAKEVGGVLNKIIEKTDGAGCFAREGIKDKDGKWYEGGTVPQVGDIVTFCWNGYGKYNGQDAYFSDHVGIVEKVSKGYIYTIEGNANGTNDTSTVTRKKYAIKNAFINGYYRPNWKVEDKPKPIKKPKPTPQKGKDSIKEVQRWLNHEYGTHCTIDGIYGEQTKSAIVGALQCYLNVTYKAKLNVDGIFGTLTQSQIRDVKRGAKGFYVRILQCALICHNKDTGGFDGEYGAITEQSVKDFQAVNQIVVDGIAGKFTFNKLLK